MLNEIDLSSADLNLLVLFDVVMAERNVGRAADRLHLSPSAVSHGLGRLRRLFSDPLFLRTPKGVAPTTRATELAVPIADILARVKSVMSIAEPFDPVTSSRRFIIGAPDGVSAVFLAPLFTELNKAAPGIDLGVRQLLPTEGESSPDRAWREAFTSLDEHAMDIAILPTDNIAARFLSKTLYEEEFVIAARVGHPFVVDPTLEHYCQMQHLLVSLTGDPFGFVDRILAEEGRKRRIPLTVPNFMFALAILAETDLISALPKRFVAIHAQRFGVVGTEAPLSLGRFRLNAVAPQVAMMDLGLVWLFDMLESVGRASATNCKGLSRSQRKS
jgi:DNA-binding transcriptional LysR family regulator